MRVNGMVLAGVTALAVLTGAPAWAQQAPASSAFIEDMPDYRGETRNVITGLGQYAKQRQKDFVVLVEGGLPLAVWADDEATLVENEALDELAGTPVSGFLRAIDGMMLKGAYCGGEVTDMPTSPDRSASLMADAEVVRDAGGRIFSLDFCTDADAMIEGYRNAARDGVVAYAGDERLSRIPRGSPWAENADSVTTLGQVRNFLVSVDNTPYATKADWLAALQRTNHDMLVIDVFHHGETPLERAEIAKLRYKNIGSRRLVLAAITLGYAHDTAFYWDKNWQPGDVSWAKTPVEGRPGTWVADITAPQWQEILGKYVAGAIDLGFDGVLLRDADIFERLEGEDGVY